MIVAGSRADSSDATLALQGNAGRNTLPRTDARISQHTYSPRLPLAPDTTTTRCPPAPRPPPLFTDTSRCDLLAAAVVKGGKGRQAQHQVEAGRHCDCSPTPAGATCRRLQGTGEGSERRCWICRAGRQACSETASCAMPHGMQAGQGWAGRHASDTQTPNCHAGQRSQTPGEIIGLQCVHVCKA